MPIRPQFAPYREPQMPNSQETPKVIFESQDFLGGLVTEASPEMIPVNSFQNVKNVQYTRNMPIRRNGLRLYSLPKPDSFPVRAYFGYFSVGIGVTLLRFSGGSIYKAGVASWTLFTGPVLNAGNNQAYSFTVADNRAFFSNNGEDPIMELFPLTNSYAALGDAPQYKYLTSAFGRIIGANLVDNSPGNSDVPYQVGWSGDLNFDEWNPSVDITAGFTPLANSPADLSDNITGIFALASVMCITRERSIWLATNLPSATNPFNFYVDSPKIGCDCPQTIAATANSLVFYNFQSSCVYVYTPGSQPQIISAPVKRAITSNIVNINELFASYNYNSDTYTLFISNSSSSLVKAYSFNFTTKTWTYDEYSNTSSCNDINVAASTTTLDELGTTPLDDLFGDLDDLGGVPESSPRFFGFTDGETCVESIFTAQQSDIADIELEDNSQPFESIWDSKTLTYPNYESYFNYISIEFVPYTTGTVSLLYSKDDGVTIKSFKDFVVTSAMLFKSQIILSRKPVLARRICWRVSTSDCMITLNSFKVETEKAGIATK